jgi:hypothetical protein
VTSKDLEALSGAQAFPGRSEETLFGFSVREVSAPNSAARARAAERLKALAHPVAPLHAETEAPVQVALLNAFAALAKAEGVVVVQPLLASRAPDVRIAALKVLLTLDAGQAGPHLASAMSDPDKAVSRRASLLALGLEGDEALALGTRAIRDAGGAWRMARARREAAAVRCAPCPFRGRRPRRRAGRLPPHAARARRTPRRGTLRALGLPGCSERHRRPPARRREAPSGRRRWKRGTEEEGE